MSLKVFAAIAAAASLLMAVSCNKENNADNSWKELPTGEISHESGNAALSVNGVTSSRGTVQLTASAADKASLKLDNFIPGYGEVVLPVEMTKAEDGESYDFYGTSALAAPKINLTKNNQVPAVYFLTAEGNVTLDGKITVNVATSVSEDYQGGLTGKWDILRKSGVNEDETLATSPLVLKWTVPGKEEKMVTVEGLAKIFGGSAIANLLDRISFLEDGNFTAKYYSGDGVPEINVPEEVEDGYEFKASHNTWAELPAIGCALWYACDGYLHLVPDPATIAAVAGDDTEVVSLEELMGELNDLKQYGVDTQKLAAVLIDIMNNGVTLKYEVAEGGLSVTADKAILDPAMQAFIPALPTLDKVVEGILQDPEQKATAELINDAFHFLGISKPSELATLWNSTTEFSVTLNFTAGK